MDSQNTLELLAPAKDLATGLAALAHGADAVYIGAQSFGARHQAGNPLDDIRTLCEAAHQINARIYVTLNTLLKENEIEAARSLAFDLAKVGVDALIIQDMGLLEGPLPNIEIHASTQCDIRTPEKAKFLDDVGFSQVVLARELNLTEIKACFDAMPRARIEYFVHGALCVSYSGQCFISEATRGRSANRGECAQLCRLPYDVYQTTDDGKEELIQTRSHVLSLKDNDQTENLADLIAAGVRSFKIEGRLKDVSYVKNITAWYRQKLDAFMAEHPEFTRTSGAVTTLNFAPNPAKTFRRGQTEYFTHGRDYSAPYALADLKGPKSTGEAVGMVERVAPGRLEIRVKKGQTLANGDGLLYLDTDDQMQGLGINTAEERRPGLWTVTLRDRNAMPEGLLPGAQLTRNLDRAFERVLSGDTAQTQVPVTLTFVLEDHPKTFTLLVDDGVNVASASAALPWDEASNPERNLETLKKNLNRLGDTHYVAKAINVPEDLTVFAPASVVNMLRRDALAELTQMRNELREVPTRLPEVPGALYPNVDAEGSVDYRANIANSKALAFYRRHGVKTAQRAFEIVPVENAALMTCRHCIRASLKRCPKMLKFHPEWLEKLPKSAFKPLPLILVSAKGDRFQANFHCRRTPCEMTLTKAT